MENVDAALKSSFRKDVAVGLTDDFCGINLENVNFPEDFSVDELFDFSGDVEPAGEDEEEQETEQDPVVKRQVSDESSNFSSGDDSMSFPTATDLVVPLEDLAGLEWLSNFVEDSFPESYAGGIFPAKPHWSSLSTQKSTAAPPAENPSTTKIRTKRRRSKTQNRFFTKPVEPVKSMETNGPAVKRQKRRKQKCEGRQTPRRCGHCGVQKTPQWREGPTGAKTLCNACGVRFKSGRLLPEYRPACSPTFSSELHSNSHRKVLEMRRQKEMSSGRVEPSLILPGCA